MNDEEAREVIASIAIAAVLAATVLVYKQWDYVRCWLPDFPRFRVYTSQQGPTPIEEAEAINETSNQAPEDRPNRPAGQNHQEGE